MPDTPVERGAGGPYPGDMESRVAVLEHIAGQLDRRFESLERRLDSMAQEHRADFRWLLGVMLAGFGTMLAGFGGLLGVMAHGFHWL
ncbi:MAG TPA: hypothetical protein VFW75_14835 [Acetobacteraceae bacterium]|nr:hypothetical protein [Acetobacteraceae bacterium]